MMARGIFDHMDWHEGPPPDEYKDGMNRVEFLAVRRERRIICWWNDDRYARKPKPYWDGTDSFLGIRILRENAPTHWLPLPDMPS
jgi:hypothetical protein